MSIAQDILNAADTTILVTPRTAHRASVSPATTPRRVPYDPFGGEPPPAPGRADCEMPKLMKGIVTNSITLVREAIEEDFRAASFPFWSHNIEPPLCLAVRKQCKAEIISFLLEHGADKDARNVKGQCPADMLQSFARRDDWYIELAKLLEVRPPDAAPAPDLESQGHFGLLNVGAFPSMAPIPPMPMVGNSADFIHCQWQTFVPMQMVGGFINDAEYAY